MSEPSLDEAPHVALGGVHLAERLRDARDSDYVAVPLERYGDVQHGKLHGRACHPLARAVAGVEGLFDLGAGGVVLHLRHVGGSDLGVAEDDAVAPDEGHARFRRGAEGIGERDPRGDVAANGKGRTGRFAGDEVRPRREARPRRDRQPAQGDGRRQVGVCRRDRSGDQGDGHEKELRSGRRVSTSATLHEARRYDPFGALEQLARETEKHPRGGSPRDRRVHRP